MSDFLAAVRTGDLVATEQLLARQPGLADARDPNGVSVVLVALYHGHRPLADFHFPKGVYAIGRLDGESEGLLLLSDEPELNARLLHPTRGHRRTYWAQVERIPSPESFAKLESGVVIGGRKTLPCRAWMLDPQPALPPRDPPIRYRAKIPTSCGKSAGGSWMLPESRSGQR